jgi:hypothetical protein
MPAVVFYEGGFITSLPGRFGAVINNFILELSFSLTLYGKR